MCWWFGPKLLSMSPINLDPILFFDKLVGCNRYIYIVYSSFFFVKFWFLVVISVVYCSFENTFGCIKGIGGGKTLFLQVDFI